MKAVNVDDVLKILNKYGEYIFVTDEKRYSSMVDEIANLNALDQETFKPMVEIDLYSVIKQKYIEREVIDKIRAEIRKKMRFNSFNEAIVSFDDIRKIFDECMAESEGKE